MPRLHWFSMQIADRWNASILNAPCRNQVISSHKTLKCNHFGFGQWMHAYSGNDDLDWHNFLPHTCENRSLLPICQMHTHTNCVNEYNEMPTNILFHFIFKLFAHFFLRALSLFIFRFICAMMYRHVYFINIHTEPKYPISHNTLQRTLWIAFCAVWLRGTDQFLFLNKMEISIMGFRPQCDVLRMLIAPKSLCPDQINLW